MVANGGDTVVSMYISRRWDKCGGRIVARRKSCRSTGLIHSEDFISGKPPLSVPVFNVTRSFLSGIPLIHSSTRDFFQISIPRMKVNLNQKILQSILNARHIYEKPVHIPSTVFILILIWPSNWFTNFRILDISESYFIVIGRPKDAKVFWERLPRCNLWRLPSRRRSSRNLSAFRATKDLG